MANFPLQFKPVTALYSFVIFLPAKTGYLLSLHTKCCVNRIIVSCRSTHLTYTFHITKFCMHITSTCSWSRSLFNEKIDLTLTATNSRAAMIFQRCIYEDPVRTRKLLLGGNQISPLWYMKITRERKKGKLHIYPVNYI